MKNSIGENNLINNIINKNIKNLFVNTITKYSIITITPFFLFLIYNYVLYKYVYLAFNNAQINNGSNLFLGLAIFILMTSAGSILLLIVLEISTNFLFHYFLGKTFHLSLSYYKIFNNLENKLLKFLIIPHIMYIISVCLAFKLSFSETLIFGTSTIIFYIYTSKFLNKLTFLLTSIATNFTSKINISFNHFFILFQFLFVVIFLKLVVWIQSDILNRYLYIFLIAFLVILGNVVMSIFFKNHYLADYVIKNKYNRESKNVTDIKINKNIRFEVLSIVRNYRTYFDYIFISMIIVFLLKILNLTIEYVNIVLVISCILSPILLGIMSFFNLDFIRFPIKKIKMKLIFILFSITTTIFLFMILIIISGEIIYSSDIVILFIVLFTSISLQLILKIKYDPSNNENNIHLFAFYGFIAQALILLLPHLSFESLISLLVVTFIFLVTFVIIGGKYEVT